MTEEEWTNGNCWLKSICDMNQFIITSVNTTLNRFSSLVDVMPFTAFLVKYVKKSYQNDPLRVVFELLLFLFAIKYAVSSVYRPDTNEVKLTEQEIDEMADEWQPEPLVDALTDKQKLELDRIPVIQGAVGKRVRVDGSEVFQLASFDFLGVSECKEITQAAADSISKYGVGACGPPGFYGTLDVHLELEKKLAAFLGTDEAIIYTQAFSTVSSVIPAFSKRGDLIICDEGVSFPVQKGVQISRSTVKYFKHNDMNDLERILDEIHQKDLKSKKQPTRRFIVVEGLYVNYGDICPLPKLVELKLKYKYRLIVEEAISFGVLGKRGAGVADHFGLESSCIDIFTSSLSNALGSSGGFCAGSKPVVDHQRLSGSSYCFSAAMPAMLAISSIKALDLLSMEGEERLGRLRANIKSFRKHFNSYPFVVLDGDELHSPIIHFRFPPQWNNVQQEEEILDTIVEAALKNGLLLTRSKYVSSQEYFAARPSIRICISASHSTEELDVAAKSIIAIMQSVFFET